MRRSLSAAHRPASGASPAGCAPVLAPRASRARAAGRCRPTPASSRAPRRPPRRRSRERRGGSAPPAAEAVEAGAPRQTRARWSLAARSGPPVRRGRRRRRAARRDMGPSRRTRAAALRSARVDPRVGHSRSAAHAKVCARSRAGKRSWRSNTASFAASFSLERRQIPPRAQQRLLHRILGVLQGAEHPIAVRVQRPPVWPHELGERFLIPSDGCLD